MNGVSINGVHSDTLPILMRTTRRPILARIRMQYEDIPGRDGSYDFSEGTLEDAVIEIHCALITTSVSELRYYARKVGAWVYGGGGKVKIAFDDEPDLFYFGRSANQIDPEQLATIGEFTLQFRCDPVAYFYQDAAVPDLDDRTILGRDVRGNDQYTFTVTGNTTVEVNNFGTHFVAPVVQITGSFTTFAMTVGGRTLGFTEALPGGTLVIDHDRLKAYVGVTNKLNKLAGSFPIKLSVGVNQISITGTGLNCSVSFVFKPRFL